MQSTIDVILAAANAARTDGVRAFGLVTDAPPDELAASDLPALVQYGDRGRPESITTTDYVGTIDYTCFVLADGDEETWSDLDTHTKAFLTALFARSEAQAQGYQLVEPYRRYQMQIGARKCLVRELAIRAPFHAEYE